MTQDEMMEVLELEVKGLSSALESDDYENATNDAARETEWAFPVTDDFKIFWMKRRSKRHLFYYLWSETAVKFKVKQYSLNQKFEHFKELVRKEDADFRQIVEDRPDKFIAVDTYKLFGTLIGPGIQYDAIGKDITDYTPRNWEAE